MSEETGFDWVTPTEMVKLARDASRAARWSERRPIVMVILKGLLQWSAFVGVLVGTGSIFGWMERGADRKTIIFVSVGIVSLFIIGFSHRRVRSVFQGSMFSQIQRNASDWLRQRKLRKLERAGSSPQPGIWNFFTKLFYSVRERALNSDSIRQTSRQLWPYFKRPGIAVTVVVFPVVLFLFLALDGVIFTRKLLTQLSGSERLEGPARVIDGQTLIVDRQKIRLEGIDAPELNQKCRYTRGRSKRIRYWSCGRRAAGVLKSMVRAERVSCKGYRDNQLGVLTAVCTVKNKNINHEMVARGYAWAAINGDQDYLEGQLLAQKAKSGVWRGQSEPPWEYREKLWKAAEKRAPEGCPIKGNINSRGRLYYVPWSPSYKKIRIRTNRGERWFCSEKQAVMAGWRPAS